MYILKKSFGSHRLSKEFLKTDSILAASNSYLSSKAFVTRTRFSQATYEYIVEHLEIDLFALLSNLIVIDMFEVKTSRLCYQSTYIFH